jgi:hypothetical protein
MELNFEELVFFIKKNTLRLYVTRDFYKIHLELDYTIINNVYFLDWPDFCTNVLKIILLNIKINLLLYFNDLLFFCIDIT